MNTKVGRNDPCTCGSGKKYKRCHGSSGTQPLPAPTHLPLFTPTDRDPPVDSPGILHYRFYCLAFLDILGQRRKLRQLPRILKKDEETTGLLAETAGYVLRLRSRLKTVFEEFQKPTIFTSFIPEPLREHLEAAKQAVHYRGFSDSLMMSMAFTGDIDQCGPIIGTYGCMAACCVLHLASLAEKRPIRGGIDVGQGMDLGDHEVYGPCLESAHYLESRVADYPRIVVGDTLWGYLEEVATHTPTSVAGQIAQRTAGKCQRMTTVVGDLRMLDFLGEDMARIAPSNERQKMFELANDYINEQVEWAQSQNDQKHLDRYIKLRAYFESRKELWR